MAFLYLSNFIWLQKSCFCLFFCLFAVFVFFNKWTSSWLTKFFSAKQWFYSNCFPFFILHFQSQMISTYLFELSVCLHIISNDTKVFVSQFFPLVWNSLFLAGYSALLYKSQWDGFHVRQHTCQSMTCSITLKTSLDLYQMGYRKFKI